MEEQQTVLHHAPRKPSSTYSAVISAWAVQIATEIHVDATGWLNMSYPEAAQGVSCSAAMSLLQSWHMGRWNGLHQHL